MPRITTAASDLVYWLNPLVSGLTFGAGMVVFYLSAVKGYSSITLLAYALMINIIARIVYRSGSAALAELNVLPKRTPPVVVETFITAEEIQQCVPCVTSTINGAARAAARLVVAEPDSFTLRWLVALFTLAMLGRILGTTGVFALAFISLFTLPVGYSHKRVEVDKALATAEATGKQLMAQAQSKVNEVLKGNKPSAAAKKAI